MTEHSPDIFDHFAEFQQEEARKPQGRGRGRPPRKKILPENTPKHNIGRNIRSDKRTAQMAKATLYVIGDVHGRADLLDRLLRNVDKDKTKKKRRYPPSVIFIGDIVDQGPDSKGAMELVAAELQRNQGKSRLLLGNHDEWLFNFIRNRNDAQTNYHWIYEAGGYTTFASYGIILPDKEDYRTEKAAFDAGLMEFRSLFAYEYRSHMKALSDAVQGGLQIGNVIFAHGGMQRGKELNKQNTRMMRWIREEFLYDGADDGKLVIHGHSFARGGVPNVRANRINIDTVAGKYGLTCLVIDPARSSLTFYQSGATGIRELRPEDINTRA